MGTQQKTQGQEGQGMEIDVKINSISMDGTILATASINLNQCLAIRNVRLMNGEKGVFLSMPSYRTGTGEYKDICFPITAGFRTRMTEAMVSAYKEALAVQQGKMENLEAAPASRMAPAGQSM